MKDGEHYHNQGDPEGKHNHRKLAGLILLSVIFALIAYGLAQTAQTTADNNANITNVFEVVVNNTDKGCYGDEGGTCERVNGTTYNASNYSMNVYSKYHVVNNNAHTVFYVYINGTRVLWRDFTTIQADQNESFYFNVPKGANFSYYNNSIVHHVEWREYPILSGRNGTLSVNQTFVGSSFNSTYDAYGSSKVNKSGDTMTGLLNISLNNDKELLYLTAANSGQFNPPVLRFRRSNGTILAPAKISYMDEIGALNFQGYADTSFKNVAAVEANICTLTPSDSDMAGCLLFYTTSHGTASYTEKMRLTPNGSLLINTTTDNEKLSVDGNITSNGNYIKGNGSELTGVMKYSDARYKIGNFNFNGTQTSNLAITGIGFKPASVGFYAVVDSTSMFSVGTSDCAGNSAIVNLFGEPTIYGYTIARSYQLGNATQNARGNILSCDADGFTVQRAQTAWSYTTNITIIYTAYR